MATKNTILGTVPKSRGRYTEGDTTTKWYYDNILEYKGSSFRCISEASTGITGAPATYNSNAHTLVPNTGWEFFVDTTGALDVEERLTENEDKLFELEKEINSTDVVIPEILSNDHFIAYNGTYQQSDAYHITKGIKLNYGDKIKVKCVASANISVISKVVNEGESYGLLGVIGLDGDNVREYEYIATESLQVAISCNNSNMLEVIIFSKSLTQKVKEISADVEFLAGNKREIIPVEKQKGFISLTNIVLPNNDFVITKKIHLKKNECISATCAASASSYTIVKVIDENQGIYEGIIVGEGVDKTIEYNYQAVDDMDVCIVYLNGGTIFVTIKSEGYVDKRINTLLEGEKESYNTTDKYNGFITLNNTFGENNDFRTTEKIHLKEGETISALCTNSLNAYTISKVINEATKSYEGIVKSKGYTLTDYVFTAKEDIDICITYYAQDKLVVYKKGTGNVEKIVNETLSEKIAKVNAITVGSGKMFNSLVDAVESITDSSESNQYVIELYEGEYETVVASKISSTYKGLIIPNYVSIIGIGNRDNIIIKGTFPETGNKSYANIVSTINLTMNGSVENVTIKAKNIRYCNHDDGDNNSIPGSMITVSHTFKYVKFVYDTVNSGFDVAKYCVGIGAQADKEIIFEYCEFHNESGYGSIIFHDNGRPEQKRGGRMVVKNCLFFAPSFSNTNCILLTNSGGQDCTFTNITNSLLYNGIKIAKSTAGSPYNFNRHKVTVSGCKGYRLDTDPELSSVDWDNDVHTFCNSNL